MFWSVRAGNWQGGTARIERLGGVDWPRELRTQETFHLVNNCGKKPHEEDDDGGSLNSVELDVVEKPVRIETAALHTISFPAERDYVLEAISPVILI